MHDLDISSNSHDYLTKNSIVLVGRMNVLLVGMKELTVMTPLLKIYHKKNGVIMHQQLLSCSVISML